MDVHEAQELHVVFFPFMGQGHMIPALDIARLFSVHDNVKATIITTPLNKATFTKANEESEKIGDPVIKIEVFKFPTKEVGLPDGYESPDLSLGVRMIQKFFKGTEMLSEQLEEYLEKVRPNCLVADMFFPWATDSAAKFNIPRLVFHGISYFSLCAQEIIRVHEPYKNVSSDDEPFILPSLPHKVQMRRLHISEDFWKSEGSEFKRRMARIKESEVRSYGVIVNSFYELEPDYADYFRKELGRRAWSIGPVSMSNRRAEVKAQRGKQASIDEHECMKWLSSKKPDSVIYLCFGSTSVFIAPQLQEIAMALEASGKNFIWVVRDGGDGKNEKWLPEGFEERMEGKGLIIRGWAPQVLILEHEAIGAFVTHCGWNSILEGVAAGVPMVTWPVFAEQFYNELLVTQILKTGVSVGVKKWDRKPSLENIIKQEVIETALREIMEGNKSEERRIKTKKLKEMARQAVEEGGSSYSDIHALLAELRGYQLRQQN